MVLTQHVSIQPSCQLDTAFPYHYGSYATGYKFTVMTVRHPGFHTTMVLTQRCENETEKCSS